MPLLFHDITVDFDVEEKGPDNELILMHLFHRILTVSQLFAIKEKKKQILFFEPPLYRAHFDVNGQNI